MALADGTAGGSRQEEDTPAAAHTVAEMSAVRDSQAGDRAARTGAPGPAVQDTWAQDTWAQDTWAQVPPWTEVTRWGRERVASRSQDMSDQEVHLEQEYQMLQAHCRRPAG
jgi:hypothetical protein